MSSASLSQDSLNLLNKSVDDKITFFRDLANSHRSRAFQLRLTLSALSATVTVLLGIKYFKWPYILSNLALVASGMVTVLTAWETFWNNRELWLVFQDGVTLMHKLKLDISYATTAGGPTQAQFEDFRKEFDRIIDEFNKTWKKARSK